MQRAQDLAKDILNLSQSDLDDIMSADGEHAKLVGHCNFFKRQIIHHSFVKLLLCQVGSYFRNEKF